MHNIMANSGIGDLTPLQRQLLLALVDSGISKDALVGACYELYAIKQAERLASTDGASETDQRGDRLKHHLQETPSRSDAIKLEEASRRMVTQDARLATGRLEVQQMNFVDHMLRYVSRTAVSFHMKPMPDLVLRSNIAVEVLMLNWLLSRSVVMLIEKLRGTLSTSISNTLLSFYI